MQNARQHFENGRKAFEAKDYPTALKEFRAGYELEPRPGFLLNMGHASLKMGELPQARELYGRFLQTSPTGEERRAAEEGVAHVDWKLGTMPGAAVVPETATVPGAQPVEGTPLRAPGPPATSPGASEPAAPSGTERAAPKTSTGSASMPGSGTQPSESAVLIAPASPPLSAPSPESKPTYKKWWLLTGIGLVAVGVVSFLVFGAKGSDGRDSGSWGQIKL